MGLDYGYTCSDIDQGISQCKSDIESQLSDMLDECCPLLEGEQKNNFINNYLDAIYADIEQNFEDVRKSNEDMRKAADEQIDSIENDLDSQKAEIEDLNNKITELEDQITELESEVFK